MAQHRAIVLATLEQSSAGSRADVFGLESIVRLQSGVGSQGSHFSLRCYSLLGFYLPRATLVSAFVPSAIQCCPAGAHALRRLVIYPLVTKTGGVGFSTTTLYIDPNQTDTAFAIVASLRAGVAARKCLFTDLLAGRDRSFTVGSRLGQNIRQQRFTARTMRDGRRIRRTGGIVGVLRVAWL